MSGDEIRTKGIHEQIRDLGAWRYEVDGFRSRELLPPRIPGAGGPRGEARDAVNLAGGGRRRRSGRQRRGRRREMGNGDGSRGSGAHLGVADPS